MTITNEVVWHDVETAIEQLWNWVGERSNSAHYLILADCHCMDCQANRARVSAYSKVKDQMRTLFAGLIDFEQTEEKEKHGL